MSKLQEEEKRRKRQGHDEIEPGDTSEAYLTRQRAPKRRKTSELLSRHISNATNKSPLGTTGKARFLWTTKTKEAFFEGLCKHGKDFEKICVFMNTKPHLKQVVPSLSRNQVRFFYYRTWKLVSGYYTAANCRQEDHCEPSKPCESAGTTDPVSNPASVTTAIPAAIVKEDQLSDYESNGDDQTKQQQPMDVVRGAQGIESRVGGAQDMENIAVEEEMFSDDGQATPMVTEKEELSDNTEHESEDESEEEPSPLEAPAEEEPVPSMSADGHKSVQEPTGGGANSSLTSKVMVDGRMIPLDLVSLICYGKYRSKLQALGNKAEIGSKLHQLVYTGAASIRYKGRRMQLKTPICVALKNDSRSIEQSHDGIVTGGIPDGVDHVIVKLTAYNSDSWSHVQQLSFNPRLRIVLSSHRTLVSVLKLLVERWSLPELEGSDDVKMYYWPQADKDRDWNIGHQILCNLDNHSAVALTYDSETTLGDVAVKLQARNSMELLYDISALVQKGGVADRMEPLLRVVRAANRNVKPERSTVPRVLSRISPRKFGIFGSSFHQRMTAHRIGFGSRGRVKLDFSSPKKDDVSAVPAPPPDTVATPTEEESNSPPGNDGVDIIIQTPINGTPEKKQSQTPTSCKNSQLQHHKNGVKSKRNIKRNRIVTFDEQQLNQSGSFSNIPIKNLMLLAQQQVASFRSPKKSNSTPPSISPPETPPPPVSRQLLNKVTAVTIPTNQPPLSTVVTASLPISTTAVQQPDVGRASSHTHTTAVTTSWPVTTSVGVVGRASSHTHTTAATTSRPITTIKASVVKQQDVGRARNHTHPTSSATRSPETTVRPVLAPALTRRAKIQSRPIVSQRSLVPQPLSFFTSTTNTSVTTSTVGTHPANQKSSDDGRTVPSTTEAVKQKTSLPGGKPLNIQNLTIVQQIQLLALIQQYQNMQRPKSTTPQKPSPQDGTDKPPSLPDQLATEPPQQKQSADKVCSEGDEELYKLLHATPIRTPKRPDKRPVPALPPDEVSSDTVNNLLSSLMKSKQSDKQQQDLAQLASETADLLPSFTAGLIKSSGGDDLVQEVMDHPLSPSDELPTDLLPGGNSTRSVAMDTLPPFDSDNSNHFGLFNLDNLLEDTDASLGAFLAYLESPKKKGSSSTSSNLPDLFCNEQDNNTGGHHNNSSEEFSFQALLEENSQDLSNKFRELSGLLLQHDAPPYST